MKLFYCPRTRSFTSLWMLEECGAKYDLGRIDITSPNHPSPKFLKVNPLGKLAALEDGGMGFGETAAILAYLADKFPAKKLSPAATDPRRGRYLQWLAYSATVIEPAMMAKAMNMPSNTRSAGYGDYDRAMKALEDHLPTDGWIMGADFSAADLYLASTLSFGMMFKMIDARPAFVDFEERAKKRPAWAAAQAIEARETAAFDADKVIWAKS
jgi:glutathione S-transferase